MKTCPICNAVAFDDAPICFGCLHRFEECDSNALKEGEPTAFDENTAVLFEAKGSNASGRLPALLISVQAVPDENGVLEWRCDVGGHTLPVPMPS